MAKTHYPVDAVKVMRELCSADPHLARVIREVGSFPTKKQKSQPPFESLLRAIVYQQLAGAAAKTIYGRVQALGANGKCPTPEEILRARKPNLRRAGLSRQKIAAVKDLAKKNIGRHGAYAGCHSAHERGRNFGSAHAGARDW